MSAMSTREKLLALVIASGIYVSVEPAPFDLAIIALGVLLTLTRQLVIPRGAAAALVLLALFGVSNLVSLVFVKDTARAYSFLAITVYLMALWGVLLAAQGRGGSRSTDAMMWGYAVGSAVAGVLGIAAYLGAPVIGPIMAPSGRLFGMFKDPNVYGAYLVPAAVFAFSRIVGRTSKHRVAWIATLAACGGGVFLSFSRGAWINLTVATSIFFLLFTSADGLGKTWWRTMVFLPVVAIVIGIFAYQLLSVDAISEMFTVRFGYQEYDNTRFAVQLQAVEVGLRTPLGLGPGSTEGAFHLSAHSLYVRTLVENGALGALSLFSFFGLSLARAAWVSIFSASLEDRLRFAVIAGSLVGILVESAVIDTVHWRHFWIFCALAWAPMPRLRPRGAQDFRPVVRPR